MVVSNTIIAINYSGWIILFTYLLLLIIYNIVYKNVFLKNSL